MSSSINQRPKSSSQYPSYQPIPTVTVAMDNPAMSRSSSSGTGSLEDSDRTGAGTLPSTYSSQQLMPQSESDNLTDIESRRQSNIPTPSVRGSVTRSQWFTVGVLCFVNLINYMDRFTIAGVLEDIQKDFKIADDDAGLLQTVFILSYMVFAPLFGYLGDRYSRRWIMAIGVLLWSTTTLLGSFMTNFGWFITFRALVGIGEASYSTIAPTIISDLFVHNLRSKMLAVFYFAIPVGSGFGYIVGSETAHLANNWRWALRVTPFLGIAAVILIMLINDPQRGESEGSHNLSSTTYGEDIKYLVKNRSFMLSTAGFTCVAFVAGALAWWGPKFIYLGLKMQPGNENLMQNDVSYKFGMVTMAAGIVGVPLGSMLAQRFRPTVQNCDPYICAAGLLSSAPMVYLALVLPQTSSTWCFLFIFGAMVALNMSWSIVADIILYVVVPTRRSTAEAFQILISHAFGDAGSPYFVGVLSEAIKKHLRTTTHRAIDLVSSSGMESLSLTLVPNATAEAVMSISTTELPTLASRSWTEDTDVTKFEALQYALFSTSFVEVLGGIFFLITAAFVVGDKQRASQVVHEGRQSGGRVDIDEIS